jgi:hypothetical protein
MHDALACIRQLGLLLNQPLDFSDIREQLEGSGLTLNPTNPDHILTPAARGSGIPPPPDIDDPKESWDTIESVFGKLNIIRAQQLENQILTLSPNNFSCLGDYLSRFKTLEILCGRM